MIIPKFISDTMNDTTNSPSKQIKNIRRKTYHQIHQHNHHHHDAVAGLPHFLRQSSCFSSILLHQKHAAPPPPPHVQLEMAVHPSTIGSVFLNHFPNNSVNNQASLSSATSLPPILPSHRRHHHHHHHQKPPLLPLPVVPKPTFHSLPALTRHPSVSSPIPRKQPNQKPAATPNHKRSSTHQKNINKKENTSNNNIINGAVGSTKGVDSDQKEVTRRVEGIIKDQNKDTGDDVDEFIAPLSVFSLAPPPSSLPLPKFSLRQVQQNKFSCKAEAALDEVDADAATDNFCRLLKLRWISLCLRWNELLLLSFILYNQIKKQHAHGSGLEFLVLIINIVNALLIIWIKNIG